MAWHKPPPGSSIERNKRSPQLRGMQWTSEESGMLERQLYAPVQTASSPDWLALPMRAALWGLSADRRPQTTLRSTQKRQVL